MKITDNGRLTQSIRLFSARRGEKWESKIFASVTQIPSPLQRNLIAEMEPDANAGGAANISVLVQHWHLVVNPKIFFPENDPLEAPSR